ncbi:MAG: DUF6516 family protein [Dehalococcoidia bacterium]|nr:DUF6516 family protein [Dehalococcoidia bacterium]
MFLEVEEREDYLAWKRYAFEFMDRGGRTIFRYDNVPHHHGLPLFPEHKHVGPGERSEPAPAPAIRDILREIGSHER